MHRRTDKQANRFSPINRAAVCLLIGSLAVVPLASAAGVSKDLSSPERDRIWNNTIDLVERGLFDDAAKSLGKIAVDGTVSGRVLGWLQSYQAQQAERLEHDKQDFEKYERYAKERMERKEFAQALEWAIGCYDVAPDREAFLHSPWLLELAELALDKAAVLREENDWLGAWRLYSDLGSLFEREPRYRKLQREAQTHYRLNVLFKDENNWKERIERVRWEDARAALEDVGLHYVKPADFKTMCEIGLEQLLILAESESAQDEFEGLADEFNRTEFVNRLQAKLDQVQNSPTIDRRKCIEHFRRVVHKINPQTVKLPEQLIVSEMMRGAFEPLDDYTTIIWPSDADEFEKQTAGEFVGVGISIIKNRDTDEIEVVTPLEDSPAFYAGVQAGDVIKLVDGEPLTGFSLNKVVRTITGEEGTTVKLTVRRGEEQIEFPLKRKNIKIASVKGIERDDENPNRWDHWLDKGHGIGYVRLANFQKNSAEDLENVLSRLEAEGLKALVLDLRGNPGGLLESAWRISTLFLKAGDTVVSTKGRHRSENQNFYAPGDGAYADIPVTVLTDENSASASEIVAGAIRDNDRGLVVGARTFGKFSVQNLMNLGSSNAKLKITTAHYYLPSGVSLHRDPTSEQWGVEPDVSVRLVNKEKIKVYRLRRESERLGPERPEEGEDDDEADKAGDKDAVDSDDNKKDDPSEDGAAKDDAAKDGGAMEVDDDAVADADGKEKEEDKLPPIKQPDENDRPEADPQLDAARLVTKIILLGERYPSLASAEKTDGAARP